MARIFENLLFATQSFGEIIEIPVGEFAFVRWNVVAFECRLAVQIKNRLGLKFEIFFFRKIWKLIYLTMQRNFGSSVFIRVNRW